MADLLQVKMIINVQTGILRTYKTFLQQSAYSDFSQAVYIVSGYDQSVITMQGESVGASLDVSQSVHDDGEKTDWQLVTNK